ncbi:MAG: DUF368 domain-containing protein [Bacilli bacterium]|nr:DUF368 domain-containing protein [Bacilli bacterium]
MKNIILVIKGFAMGLTNLIPGISGGTIAITLGIYDRLISAISHLFSKFKENMKFLIPVGIGIVLSILTMSKAISFALDKWLFPTILFFIGAIMGGIPMLYEKVKGKEKNISSFIIFLITFTIILALTFLTGGTDVSLDSLNLFGYIKLFIVGVVAAATMIIPGVSGAAVLMTLGYYEPIVNIVKDITNFSNLGYNLSIIIPFGIGVVVGVFAIAKVIEFLLKKYEVKTYYGVLGFVTSSILSIIIQNFTGDELISFSILEVIVGVILAVVGFIAAYKLGDK